MLRPPSYITSSPVVRVTVVYAAHAATSATTKKRGDLGSVMAVGLSLSLPPPRT